MLQKQEDKSHKEWSNLKCHMPENIEINSAIPYRGS